MGEPGNGRLVIMELDKGEGPPNTFKDGYLVETSTCKWKTLRVVELPKTADFVDYSDIARRGKTIAVTSQESSALLPRLLAKSNTATWKESNSCPTACSSALLIL